MTRARRRGSEFIPIALLLAFGALQILFVERARDYLHNDVFYADAARSLLEHHFYGVNGSAETNMPPGLSGLIALSCMAGACGRVATMRLMAFLQTIGYVASYLFLRRVSSRTVAGVICILLISSSVYFEVSTEVLVAYFPYFVATMLALLVAWHIEFTDRNAGWIWWAALLGLLSALSVMMASVGIALVGALGMRAIIILVKRKRDDFRTAAAFLIAAVAGGAAQLLWMRRAPAPLEWPLIPGHPHPYLQQLAVRSGNEPDLGMATFRDVLERIATNALERSSLLSGMLLRHWIDPRWPSIAVASVLVLIVVGWILSVRRTGGEVHDWYFAGHETIYLLWPWSLEPRFFLPVAPLASLYLYRGAKALGQWMKRSPRAFALTWLPIAAIFAVGDLLWIRNSARGAGPAAGVQARVSLAIWLISFLAAVLLGWRGSWKRPALEAPGEQARVGGMRLAGQGRMLAWAVIVAFVLIGLSQQIIIARKNVDLASDVNALTPDAEAGMWVQSNTAPDAIVMARELPITWHYSGRREVWFPPTTNTSVLMEGIRRLKVNYVIVVHRAESYYLPPDEPSFDPVLVAYRSSFCLVFENPRFRIYHVEGAGQGD